MHKQQINLNNCKWCFVKRTFELAARFFPRKIKESVKKTTIPYSFWVVWCEWDGLVTTFREIVLLLPLFSAACIVLIPMSKQSVHETNMACSKSQMNIFAKKVHADFELSPSSSCVHASFIRPQTKFVMSGSEKKLCDSNKWALK